MSAPSPDLKSALALMLRGGREALKLGSLDAAEVLGREILALEPDNTDARLILGRALYHKKQFSAAIENLAIGLSPNSEPDAWIELARAHQAFRQWSQAIDAFRTAFAIRSPSALQCAELGHACNNAGRHQEAAAAFEQAASAEPANAEYWNDLGGAQYELNEHHAARASFMRAHATKPAWPAPLVNLGLVAEALSDAVGALAVADELVRLYPDDPGWVQKRGVARLSQGDLRAGWAEYRARFRNPAHKGWHVGIPKPMWDGTTALGDRGVLVWSDQGLGDQILTAGLLADAQRAAKHVVFSCEPRLAKLIKRSFPGVRTVSLFDVPLRRVDLSDTDVQASISELGPAFRPTLSDFPLHGGYLKADAARVAELRAKYEQLPGEGPLIGISWRSANETAGAQKSLALDQWHPLFKAKARFVSLQYGNVVEEVAKARSNIFVDHTIDALTDVDGFAAQVAAMDGVITTSNTTVHMAGALNVPTLLLTPLVEGRAWYWFVGRDRSAWYPSVTHIWQTKRGRWDDVIERATAEAQRWLGL